VYIVGEDFGETQGDSTLTIGGANVSSDKVVLWSNGMIIAIVPATATTGVISITVGVETKDSGDANAYDYWDGTGATATDFVVYLAGLDGVTEANSRVPDPIGCQDISGEWVEDNGWGTTGQYDLSQSGPDEQGTWTVSGSVVWSCGLSAFLGRPGREMVRPATR
jgi:hypothetical protein